MKDTIVGAHTPVTKKLWQQRFTWTQETLDAAQPQTQVAPKRPRRTEVVYPFSADPWLREHYRNPWSGVRIGRVMEDMDSLAGFVAFDHCDDGDPSTRPPLLVTATVDAIRMSDTELNLSEDMKLTGQVIWTGHSSMDIQMELTQGSSAPRMAALFTFVARNALDGRPQPINPLAPEGKAAQEAFCVRQRIADARKAARAKSKETGLQWSPEQQAWSAALLAQARTRRELPALADPLTLLVSDTALENTFTAQPQQRNLQGRIFGGFLMRRAFELAHSTAYLFSASRPRTVTVDEVSFIQPVNIGDLLKFRSWVLNTYQHEQDPSQSMVHVQVETLVTQPERLKSIVTNTFNFLFIVDAGRDAAGNFLPPRKLLPGTEVQAQAMCRYYGPGSERAALEA